MGHFELGRRPGFISKDSSILWVITMEFQGAFHGLSEAINGNIAGGFVVTGASAEATIDRFVCVQEERGKGQIVVELKQIEVDGITLNQSHANELIHQLLEIRLETDNLPVKF